MSAFPDEEAAAGASGLATGGADHLDGGAGDFSSARPAGPASAGPAEGDGVAAGDFPADWTYESASDRLDAIVRRLDTGEAGLRETLDLCREGRRLVEFCAAELHAVGQGLEELRLDELVAHLDAGRARG